MELTRRDALAALAATGTVGDRWGPAHATAVLMLDMYGGDGGSNGGVRPTTPHQQLS